MEMETSDETEETKWNIKEGSLFTGKDSKLISPKNSSEVDRPFRLHAEGPWRSLSLTDVYGFVFIEWAV